MLGPHAIRWGEMIDTSIQTALSMGVPLLTELFGVVIDRSQLSELRSHMDSRFDDMRETWRGELRWVEEVIDARLKHLEER